MRKTELFLILITTLLVAVVLPTFNKENIMDFGSTTDIVSALCNVAMASAAVYAAYRARKWFEDKASLNHLDTSHQFALQYEALLWKTYEKVFNDVIIRQELISQIKRKTTELDNIHKSVMDIVLNSTRLEVEYYGALNNHRMMLERYNITISERLNNLTNKILNARGHYYTQQSIFMSGLLEKISWNDRNIETVDMNNVEKEMKNVCALFERELVKVEIKVDYDFH